MKIKQDNFNREIVYFAVSFFIPVDIKIALNGMTARFIAFQDTVYIVL